MIREIEKCCINECQTNCFALYAFYFISLQSYENNNLHTIMRSQESRFNPFKSAWIFDVIVSRLKFLLYIDSVLRVCRKVERNTEWEKDAHSGLIMMMISFKCYCFKNAIRYRKATLKEQLLFWNLLRVQSQNVHYLFAPYFRSLIEFHCECKWVESNNDVNYWNFSIISFKITQYLNYSQSIQWIKSSCLLPSFGLLHKRCALIEDYFVKQKSWDRRKKNLLSFICKLNTQKCF